MAKIMYMGNEVSVIGYGAGGGGGSGVENMDLNLTADVYIDNGTGAEVAYGGWSATDYLDIEDSNIYLSWSQSNNYNAFYDSSKNFLSSFTSNGGQLTIPVGAKYMRLSAETVNMNTLFIFKEANT